MADPLAVPPGVGQRLARGRDRGRRGPRLPRHRRRADLAARSQVAGARARRRSPPIASTCRPTTTAIVALQIESGEPIWERRLGGAANDILALDDRLYAGSQDNFFYCVMAADGGSTGAGEPAATSSAGRSPTTATSTFVSLDNVLRAMNLVTGGQQWMRPLPIRPAWGPAKAGSTIIVAGTATGAARIQHEGRRGRRHADRRRTDAGGAEARRPRGAAKKAPAFPPLADAEVAAAPYVLEHPLTRAPLVLMLFKEIAKRRVGDAGWRTASSRRSAGDRAAAEPGSDRAGHADHSAAASVIGVRHGRRVSPRRDA